MMRKLLSLGVGIAVGAAVGVTLVVLFTPMSGEELVRSLRRGWDETMDEARKAAEQRRLELEADLARRRGQ